jgi:hypothetical protein
VLVSARTRPPRAKGGRLGRLRAAPCLLLLLLIAAPPARAAIGVECRVERAGERALVTVALSDVLDPDLRRLVELGLAGQLRVELAMHRRRAFWFDDQVAQDSRQWVLAWSRPRASMLLDQQPVNPASLVLPVLPLRSERGGLAAAEHYVDVTVRLEVVTASSLGAVAHWLVAGRPAAPAAGRGQDAEDPNRSLLPRALAGVLAADLARTARARCVLPAPRRR